MSRVSAMSPDEIAEAQMEIRSILTPASLEMLTRRGRAKGETVSAKRGGESASGVKPTAVVATAAATAASTATQGDKRRLGLEPSIVGDGAGQSVIVGGSSGGGGDSGGGGGDGDGGGVVRRQKKESRRASGGTRSPEGERPAATAPDTAAAPTLPVSTAADSDDDADAVSSGGQAGAPTRACLLYTSPSPRD